MGKQHTEVRNTLLASPLRSLAEPDGTDLPWTAAQPTQPDEEPSRGSAAGRSVPARRALVGAAAALALMGSLIGVLGHDPASKATASSDPAAPAATEVAEPADEPAPEPAPVSLPEVTPSGPQQPVTNRLTPRREHAAGRHRHEPPKPRTRPGGHGKQRHDGPPRGNKAGKDRRETKRPDKDSGKRPEAGQGQRQGKGLGSPA